MARGGRTERLAQGLEILFGPVQREVLKDGSLDLSFTAHGRPFSLHLARLRAGKEVEGWVYALACPVDLPLEDFPLAKEVVDLLEEVDLRWAEEAGLAFLLTKGLIQAPEEVLPWISDEVDMLAGVAEGLESPPEGEDEP